MRKLYILLVCAAVLFAACANEGVSFKKAEQAYSVGEYYNAAALYKQSFSRCAPKDKPKRAVRAFMMGECYRRIGFTQKAVAAYGNAVRYKVEDSTALLHLGRQQLKAGQYKQAAVNLQQYLELDPGNELARNGLKSCELAPQMKENPNIAYEIKKDATFNSRRADYSPMLVGDDADMLIITSTRNDAEGDDESGITGMKNGDLFFAKKNEQGKWQKVEQVEGEVNTEYDEGASCLSPDGKTMYFTRCSSDPDYPRYAEIWKSTRSDASWSKPVKCDISRDTLTSYAHPAVSPDGQWLYFVSDCPGGEGGLDIWRTRILDNGFGGMENVGRPINTPGDEMFPVFRPNGDFYFSSDGHPGMGGLDIFLVKMPEKSENSENSEISENSEYSEYSENSQKSFDLINSPIENLGFPMNSMGDDFGMTFEGVHNRGFFCSSRGDGKGWEHIYSFECHEIEQVLTGWVYEKDGYELPEALVYLIGNDGTNEKLSVRGDGSFTYVLKPNVDYVMLGTCKGYLNVKNELSVLPAEESEEYTLQFPLPPINVPVLIDNIFYEFDKATLTPESTEALDKLVTMLNDNPNITIELSAHCDYKGRDEYNQRLSQRRAESVVRYLIDHGIVKERLTAVGYGESRPKIVTKKLAESLAAGTPKIEVQVGDTLSEAYILDRKDADVQEIFNSLNRRTEFKVLRTTFGTTLPEYEATKKREEE